MPMSQTTFNNFSIKTMQELSSSSLSFPWITANHYLNSSAQYLWFLLLTWTNNSLVTHHQFGVTHPVFKTKWVKTRIKFLNRPQVLIAVTLNSYPHNNFKLLNPFPTYKDQQPQLGQMIARKGLWKWITSNTRVATVAPKTCALHSQWAAAHFCLSYVSHYRNLLWFSQSLQVSTHFTTIRELASTQHPK